MDTDKIKEKAEAAFDKRTYEETISKLNSERDRLERDLKKEYRNARRYVRSNPEQGIGISLLGGFVLGFVIAKILD